MDKRAFEQFYKDNVDRIYRYVFFRVGHNEDVAQDLVSEIFMKTLKNFHKYNPEISKSAWIYRIAHNHIANYFRDKKLQVDVEDVKYTLVGEDGRETILETEEQLFLSKALDGLEVEERQLVTLKYIHGYSYREMSELVGKTSDALKVATHRAVKKLRGVMIK
ncbi:MAG: RNA polymerase sigma factor [Parcubacteria group bacterium]|nr:RNA polymerase sigma factor [Parcubacteria group bacterium]